VGSRRLATLFVVLAVLGAAGFTAARLARHRVTSPAGALRVTAVIDVGSGQAAASGTVVAADGLVLTAAHLVAPQATGVGMSIGRPSRLLPADPPGLTVTTSDGRRWAATIAAVDGYLDLAVLRLQVPAGGPTPRLAFLSVPSGRAPHAGTAVRVASVGGSTRTVSARGEVATVFGDPFRRVADASYGLDTSVVSAGAAGGAAVDDAGRLIGVAVGVLAGPGNDVWRLRDAGLARPLVLAATAGGAYHSPWPVARTGREQVGSIGVGAGTADACTAGSDMVASGPTELTVGFTVSGMTAGEAWGAVIVAPEQGLVVNAAGAVPEGSYPGGSGCLSTSLGASLVGSTTWPDGNYSVQLGVGPDLDAVGPVEAFTIGVGG